jgi:hypothetical protein
VSFSLIQLGALPDDVRSAFRPMIQYKGLHTATHQGNYYYLLSLGQRPNPAYRLTVSGMDVQIGKTTVRITEIYPGPGAMVAQVISYPHLIGVSPQPIVFVDAKSGKVIS